MRIEKRGYVCLCVEMGIYHKVFYLVLRIFAEITIAMVKHPEHNGIFRFNSLEQFTNLFHFTTARAGGCSTGTYASFSLSCFAGDSEDCVRKNREQLCNVIGIDVRSLYVPHQTHGTELLLVENDFVTAPAKQQVQMLYGKDALLSSQKGVCIAVSTADCVPILLYAKNKQVIGAVHAGWRGTCGRILQRSVQTMVSHYGCSSKEIHAVIGPSISKDAFEVGNEVYEAFHANGFEMDAIASRHPDTGKHHIDLWEANRLQLLQLGVPAEQIQLTGVCTYTHGDTYFSARRLGTASGRMLTGIWME